MPRRESFAAALVALAASLAAPDAARADRFEYRVSGVAADDVLNLRARVPGVEKVSATRVLARIPPGAGGLLGTGTTEMIGSSRWYEVRFGATIGWVNGRFLAPASSALEPALTGGFFCAGADPFWSLRIAGSEAELTEAGRAPHRLAVAARGPGPEPAAITLSLAGEAGARVDIRHREWCRDGVSSLDYSFETRVTPAVGPRILRGCCSLLR